jgi:hypothetical protein
MNKLEQEELFRNLRGFLKSKGIELTEGSYSQAVEKGCSVLTDLINMGKEGVTRAKTNLDKVLDNVKRTVHEKTTPKPPKMKPETASARAGAAAESPASAPPPANGTGAAAAETQPAAPKSKPKKPAAKKQPRRTASKLPKAKPVK